MRPDPSISLTMPLSRLAVRRRPLAEQKVIRMIRGERTRHGGGSDAHVSLFERLQGVASKNGFLIRVPGAPYLGRDELFILAWLAQVQRGRCDAHTLHDDAALEVAIVECAKVLGALGINLPLPTPSSQRSDRNRQQQQD